MAAAAMADTRAASLSMAGAVGLQDLAAPGTAGETRAAGARRWRGVARSGGWCDLLGCGEAHGGVPVRVLLCRRCSAMYESLAWSPFSGVLSGDVTTLWACRQHAVLQ